MDLKAWDHTIGWGQPVYGLVLHHARAIIQPWGTDLSISESCRAALSPALQPPDKLTIVVSPHNLSTHTNTVPHAATRHLTADLAAEAPTVTSVPVPQPAATATIAPAATATDITTPDATNIPAPEQCLQISGVWLLLSDISHAQDNVFEEGITSWYPSYLVTHYALKGMDTSSISITHIGGNRKGFLAFQDVYQMYGRYVPWQMVLGGAGSIPSCVEFETAITITTYWSWLSSPVMAGHNRGLASFASSLAHHFSREVDHPGTCKRRLVFAARARNYRCIVNKEEVLAALAKTLPEYEIMVVDMAVLSLSKQIQLVRTADIFMFEHGGAGPLVMMQSTGTVSLEVFPWGFADPMYRNMAIMTGKIYLSWQNPDKAKAVGDTNDRNTNSIVDVPALMAVVTSAKHVVNNNAADKFVRTSGEPYERQLCGWCEDKQRLYACHDGDP